VSSVVALFSGGLDSTALVYSLLHDDVTVHGFGVDYGQAHVEELRYAAATAERLDISYAVWPAPAMHGVGAENIYPNRNGVLISLAATYALAVEAQAVAIGLQRRRRSRLPGLPPRLPSTPGSPSWRSTGSRSCTRSPRLGRRTIVATSRQNGWPVEDSRSCYLAGDPCGTCPACTVRAAALA